MAFMIVAITGLVRLFGFFRVNVKQLTRSTSEVTLVCRSFCLNSIKQLPSGQAEQDADIAEEFRFSVPSGHAGIP